MDDVRLIDANALINGIMDEVKPIMAIIDGVPTALDKDADIIEYISDFPTIEAQPVKRGHWVDVDYKTMEHGFIETYPNEGVCCSECRTGFKKSRLLVREYCPACGSHNGGEADEEK